MALTTSTPGIRVSLFDINRNQWADITPALTSYTYSKSLSDSVTQFSLTLKATNAAIRGMRFLPNSMCTIDVTNNGGRTWYPRLYPGFTNRPAEKISFSRAGKIHELSISGMDIGKFAIKRQVTVNAAIPEGEKEMVRRSVAKNAVPEDGMGPYEILKGFLHAYLLNDPVRFDDGLSVPYWLDTVDWFKNPNDDPGNYRAKIQGYNSFLESQGTALAMMKQFSDELFNELFFTTRIGVDGKPETSLVFRRKPYYCSEFPNAWDNLKRDWGVYEFSRESGLIASDLGLCDDQVYTYWLITANTEGVNNDSIKQVMSTTRDVGKFKNIRVPIIDGELMKRYGFVMYENQSLFIPILAARSATDVLIDSIIAATCRFFEWQCLQHMMKSGTIRVTGGAPEANVGMAAKDIDDGREYYVERMEENWSPGSLVTTLSLTRGIKMDGDNGLKTLLKNKIDAINAQV